MEPNDLVPEYQQHDTLNLDIIESHHDALSSTETITAQVAQVITATMSPVMLVKIKTPSAHADAPNRAILKLYDRRFGSSLRRSKKGKHLPCRVQDEAAFCSFVDRGDMGPFINEIEEDRRTELVPNPVADWRLEPEGQAKFEAALWRLKDLQDVLVPRLYASVRLSSSSASGDMSKYYSVSGILLQFIPGGSLYDLPETPTSPTSQQEWTSIVQRVIQGAYEINQCHILLKDSCPRNVIVEADSHQPFIIDLAQCYFKDQLFKDWEHFGFGERQEDWTPEAQWCESVRCRDNPGSIALPMQSKLKRVKGFSIDVKYPE
ncbi:kinase-like domain protein [Fusarium subglutinans]|uniref:Kinase-like domain protein n=1 Tax=Gibberella subglutinans TaxID=42677 RepID=A0A8H5KSZ5_GIBSU|nr:kinase-like domain protein [Fusarium subglutinans]KAF5578238.1 kinase-like domain protein [Fusarium subglutinans]